MVDPLLAQIAAVTNWPDSKLAELLDMRVSTVQAYRTGRRVEYLSDDEKRVLLAALLDRQAGFADLVVTLELQT